MVLLALAIVVCAGLYLLGLGLTVFVARQAVTDFLQLFASSARAHYLEMSTRLVVGGAFILAAPQMHGTLVFLGFGWILVVTTIPLLVLPWRWHHRLAQRIVPPFLGLLPLVGLCSMIAGAAILGCIDWGQALSRL